MEEGRMQSDRNGKPSISKINECCVCKTNAREKQPKLLPCLHTVCTQCVQQLQLDAPSSASTDGPSCLSAASGRLSCPKCSCSFDIGEISVNFLLDEGVQAMAAWKKHKMCHCERSVVLYKCEECHEDLCPLCREDHRRVTVTKDHLIREIHAIQNDDIQNLLILLKLCTDCGRSEAMVFCEVCHRQTCCNCQLTGSHAEHSKHHTLLTNKEAAMKETMAEKQKNWISLAAQLETGKLKAENQLEQLETLRAGSLEIIKKEFQELKDAMDARQRIVEARLCQEIDQNKEKIGAGEEKINRICDLLRLNTELCSSAVSSNQKGVVSLLYKQFARQGNCVLTQLTKEGNDHAAFMWWLRQINGKVLHIDVKSNIKNAMKTGTANFLKVAVEQQISPATQQSSSGPQNVPANQQPINMQQQSVSPNQQQLAYVPLNATANQQTRHQTQLGISQGQNYLIQQPQINPVSSGQVYLAPPAYAHLQAVGLQQSKRGCGRGGRPQQSNAAALPPQHGGRVHVIGGQKHLQGVAAAHSSGLGQTMNQATTSGTHQQAAGDLTRSQQMQNYDRTAAINFLRQLNSRTNDEGNNARLPMYSQLTKDLILTKLTVADFTHRVLQIAGVSQEDWASRTEQVAGTLNKGLPLIIGPNWENFNYPAVCAEIFGPNTQYSTPQNPVVSNQYSQPYVQAQSYSQNQPVVSTPAHKNGPAPQNVSLQQGGYHPQYGNYYQGNYGPEYQQQLMQRSAAYQQHLSESQVQPGMQQQSFVRAAMYQQNFEAVGTVGGELQVISSGHSGAKTCLARSSPTVVSQLEKNVASISPRLAHNGSRQESPCAEITVRSSISETVNQVAQQAAPPREAPTVDVPQNPCKVSYSQETAFMCESDESLRADEAAKQKENENDHVKISESSEKTSTMENERNMEGLEIVEGSGSGPTETENQKEPENSLAETPTGSETTELLHLEKMTVAEIVTSKSSENQRGEGDNQMEKAQKKAEDEGKEMSPPENEETSNEGDLGDTPDSNSEESDGDMEPPPECVICRERDARPKVECDECDANYHWECHIPAIENGRMIPSTWKCSKCSDRPAKINPWPNAKLSPIDLLKCQKLFLKLFCLPEAADKNVCPKLKSVMESCKEGKSVKSTEDLVRTLKETVESAANDLDLSTYRTLYQRFKELLAEIFPESSQNFSPNSPNQTEKRTDDGPSDSVNPSGAGDVQEKSEDEGSKEPCVVCREFYTGRQMLNCNECDALYHVECHLPPFKGAEGIQYDWKCNRCSNVAQPRCEIEWDKSALKGEVLRKSQKLLLKMICIPESHSLIGKLNELTVLLKTGCITSESQLVDSLRKIINEGSGARLLETEFDKVITEIFPHLKPKTVQEMNQEKNDGIYDISSDSDAEEDTAVAECAVCAEHLEGKVLLSCDTCEKAYHFQCHLPEYRSGSIQEWNCIQCCDESSNDANQKKYRRYEISWDQSELLSDDLRKCQKLLLTLWCMPEGKGMADHWEKVKNSLKNGTAKSLVQVLESIRSGLIENPQNLPDLNIAVMKKELRLLVEHLFPETTIVLGKRKLNKNLKDAPKSKKPKFGDQ